VQFKKDFEKIKEYKSINASSEFTTDSFILNKELQKAFN